MLKFKYVFSREYCSEIREKSVYDDVVFIANLHARALLPEIRSPPRQHLMWMRVKQIRRDRTFSFPFHLQSRVYTEQQEKNRTYIMRKFSVKCFL